MNETILRDAASAWRHIVLFGGLELEGRDDGVEEEIRTRLNPQAATLEDALKQSSTDRLLGAFLASIQPFIGMYRDILEYFKMAGAKEGRDQWRLQLDDPKAFWDLRQFHEQVETFSKLGSIDIDVPAFDVSGIWEFRRLVSDFLDVQESSGLVPAREKIDLGRDINCWLETYRNGQYLAPPTSLSENNFPTGFGDILRVLRASLIVLADSHMSRKDLQDRHRQRNCHHDKRDAFEFWSLVQADHDCFSSNLVVALATIRSSLRDDEIAALGVALEQATSGMARKVISASASRNDIETILSLPIWKHRYELYSVWIATEILKALPAHAIELHHDNGTLTFPFRETNLATISSSRGSFELISEKRSLLAHPVGEGRRGGVQPDYGLWLNRAGGPECRLTVEVKHYKRAKTRSFIHVVADYAAALPHSKIVLVNHGPTPDFSDRLDENVRTRSSIIGGLDFPNLQARSAFAKIVQDCVGNSTLSGLLNATDLAGSRSVLAVDVSGSMGSMLHAPATKELILRVAQATGVDSITLVTNRVVQTVSVDSNGLERILASSEGGAENLALAILDIRLGNKTLVLITDKDGVRTLPSEKRDWKDCSADFDAPADMVILASHFAAR